MKKLILISLMALLVPSMAFATQTSTIQKTVEGNFVIYKWVTPSQATNAIDTTKVSFADAAWAFEDTSATISSAPYSLQLTISFEGQTGTGGSGTVDSCYIGIDLSNDKLNWKEAQAITVFNTNANPVKVLTLTRAYPYVRARLKNGGAATGRSHVYISYPRKLGSWD